MNEKNEKVYINNYLQAMLYIKHGVKCLETVYNERMDKITFIFNREESYPLYLKWLAHELK